MDECMTEEQAMLAERNHNLIYGFASSKNLPIDEYYDVIAIGLCKAAKAYDDKLGKFSTLAYFCMYNEVRNHWKKQQRKSVVPENDIMSYEELDENIEVVDGYEDAEYDMLCSKLVSFFDGREKDIVTLLLNGYRRSEIADIIGCTKSTIGYYLNRIQKKTKIFLLNN